MGRGKISGSAGVAAADIVEPPVSLSCAVNPLVEASMVAFCEFLPGSPEIFLDAGSVSAAVPAGVEEAETACAWPWTTGALADAAVVDFAATFSVALGEAFRRSPKWDERAQPWVRPWKR